MWGDNINWLVCDVDSPDTLNFLKASAVAASDRLAVLA
jgi:hypothetical protein